jgi:hypothetical protein
MQAPGSQPGNEKTGEEECIDFIKPFAEEGLPGLFRLYQLLPNVFKQHSIVSLEKQEEILARSGLTPEVLQSYAQASLLVPDEPSSGKTELDCIKYIQTFLRGGLPGTSRLKYILPSLFKYFMVVTSDEKAHVLVKCGLTPYKDGSDVTFFFRGDECSDFLRAPRGLSYDWGGQGQTNEVCKDNH